MSFRATDQHVEEYHTLGYTIFRGIVPPSLLDVLRREVERGKAQVRAQRGAQVQRFQPVARYDVDLRPFQELRDLRELREAVSHVLSPRHTYADPSLMGCLIEPAEEAYCTRWHRDWRDNAAYLDVREWESRFLDLDHFNQSNCALYEDHSFWAVPGSHLRTRDLHGEAALFPARPIPEPEWGRSIGAERERRVMEYVTRMPGAAQVHLDAGDFCLYRNTLWHLGAYVPYTRRATLHDFIDTPEYVTFRQAMTADMERRKAEGHPPWEWSLGGVASSTGNTDAA